MAKAPKFGVAEDFSKHASQPSNIAHSGKDYFYVKGGFLTFSAGVGDAGKPIKLDADGLIDISMMPAPAAHAASHELGGTDELGGEMGFGSIQWSKTEYTGATIPSDYLPISFSVQTASSATTNNDYIAIARIELAGNYAGGWIQLKGMVGSTGRENHPVEIEVQMATDGAGAIVTPVITSRGRFTACGFFSYTETDGGGTGIHYCTIYFKSTNAWQTLNAEVRAQVTDATNCEITVWQVGNNIGEPVPTGVVNYTNQYWGVNYEFCVYDNDFSDFGSIRSEDSAFYIESANPLYFQADVAQNIYCFPTIASGNPQFKVYGYQTAVGVKYVDMYVSEDGSGWVRGQEYLRLQAVGNYVDILPNNASYGLVLRKHDSAGVAGDPYCNFFVEDASPDYLNIVIGQTGANFGLVIDDDDNLGVNKLPASGFKIDANGIIRGTQLYSTVAIGTAPLTVTSTTKVTNLNADTLDGYHSTSFPQLVSKSTPANVAITADATWRDIDLTSYTSSDATWVCLYIRTMTQRETHEARIIVCPYNANVQWAESRVYGGSLIAYNAHSGSGGQTYNDVVAWVPMSSGYISYYGTVTAYGYVGDSTPHILVIAYIEEK